MKVDNANKTILADFLCHFIRKVCFVPYNVKYYFSFAIFVIRCIFNIDISIQYLYFNIDIQF